MGLDELVLDVKRRKLTLQPQKVCYCSIFSFDSVSNSIRQLFELMKLLSSALSEKSKEEC